MTSARPNLCLCMIVKNEAPVIARCLAGVHRLIDTWVIIDTGSSDTTQVEVRRAMEGLPGLLVERPWVDFAHNRNEALALARDRARYTLIIDADDEFVVPPSTSLPSLDRDAYTLDIEDAGIAYRRTQIVANRLPWRYEGVLHEYLVCEGADGTAHLPFVMRRNHDGARRRDPDTYRADAVVLERALAVETDPFRVSRYTFYLAQSYRDCGEREKAVSQYLARAELGFWDQEVYVALLQAGRLMEALRRPTGEILATYARATAACPSRVEAAHAASRLCRLADDFAGGYAAAKSSFGKAMPSDGLFVEPWIYAYGLSDEFAVNAYWTGHFRDCLDASLLCLQGSELPTAERPRVANNLRFALDRLTAAERTSAAESPF